MNDDSGLLSIDFIAGFTIFMIAFIMVVTMVSGLLVGLQSRSIDYDAIAYRTGVVLAEDAGDPGGPGDLNDPNAPGWENKNFASDAEKKQIVRFGLAVSKNDPNIFSSVKVGKFFYNNTRLTDSDNLAYRQKLMLFNFNNQYLSSIPTFYRFNIRFKSIAEQSDLPAEFVPKYTLSGLYPTTYVGDDDSNVQNYGYSRRVVKIKQPSSMDVNLSLPARDPDQKIFSVQYDVAELQNSSLPLRYSIDPVNEQTASIVTLNATSPTVNLIDVRTAQYFPNMPDPLRLNISSTSPTVRVYLNTTTTDESKRWVKGSNQLIDNKSTVLLVVDPGYLQQSFTVINASYVSLECTFDNNVTAKTDPIYYSYFLYSEDPPNSGNIIKYQNPDLSPPFMIPAIMEVKVW
jgi:hypothetical protein